MLRRRLFGMDSPGVLGQPLPLSVGVDATEHRSTGRGPTAGQVRVTTLNRCLPSTSGLGALRDSAGQSWSNHSRDQPPESASTWSHGR